MFLVFAPGFFSGFFGDCCEAAGTAVPEPTPSAGFATVERSERAECDETLLCTDAWSYSMAECCCCCCCHSCCCCCCCCGCCRWVCVAGSSGRCGDAGGEGEGDDTGGGGFGACMRWCMSLATVLGMPACSTDWSIPAEAHPLMFTVSRNTRQQERAAIDPPGPMPPAASLRYVMKEAIGAIFRLAAACATGGVACTCM